MLNTVLYCLQPAWVRVAAVLLVSASVGGPVMAQGNCGASAALEVGHAHGTAGQTVKVELVGRSACEVNGFGLAIGHETSRVEFVRVDPGQFLRTHAGSQLFVLSDFDNSLGFMTLLVAFDLTAPLTVPPRSIPFRTNLVELTYRIKPGAARGVTQLRNENRKFGFPPISHVYTTERLEINPLLKSGSITIQAFRVSAGDDQMLPEGSFTTLAGSASGFRFGAVPTYRWNQTSGPPTQKITGGGTTSLTVQLPQVTGDQAVVFELEVNDGQDVSKDAVEIVVVDAGARGGELRKSPTPSDVDLPPSMEALAFVGQLEWGTDLEDGLWTKIRFQVNPHPALAELARVMLYLDRDQSSDLSGGDRLLGTVNSPFSGGQTSVSFTLNERLRAGVPVQFLLIVERSAPAPAHESAFPLWPALVVLAAGVAVTWRARRDLGLLLPSNARCLPWAGVALALALLAPACSGGGGGGGGGSGNPAGVVFSIDDESDVELRGETTGTPGGVSGLPLRGPELAVD